MPVVFLQARSSADNQWLSWPGARRRGVVREAVALLPPFQKIRVGENGWKVFSLSENFWCKVQTYELNPILWKKLKKN